MGRILNLISVRRFIYSLFSNSIATHVLSRIVCLIGGLLGLAILAVYFTQLNRVFLFWIAFVLTRPFGATFGDLLTKPAAKGGLNFGTVGSSLILASLLIGFVVYTSYRPSVMSRDIQKIK